jgi:predicted cupin superfamily sugar epimerase
MTEQKSLTFDQLRSLFDMRPQEDGEGTLIRQNLNDGNSTAIVALSGGDHFSALHRLHATEVYHFYGGAAREFLLLHPDGRVTAPVLGPDYVAGQQPQLVVPAGVWQGSRSTREWSLTGATMAPGFRSDGFDMGDAAALSAEYPEAAERIQQLVHPDS